MDNTIVKFKLNKITKNTIRFEEVLDSVTAVPQIGTVYIPKPTLAAIGYTEGDTLVVTLSVNKS